MKSLLEPVREIEDDKTVALCMNWKVVAQEILQSRMTFKFIEIGYVNKSASTNASAQRFGAMKDLPFIVIRGFYLRLFEPESARRCARNLRPLL